MTAAAILAIIQGILTALGGVKTLPGVATEVIDWIETAEGAIAKALAAHQQAQQVVDPTQLKQIPQV